MVKDWKKRAKKQGSSISKFVIEHVENSLHQEEDPSYRSRGELIKEINEIKEETQGLHADGQPTEKSCN